MPRHIYVIRKCYAVSHMKFNSYINDFFLNSKSAIIRFMRNNYNNCYTKCTSKSKSGPVLHDCSANVG